MSVMAKTVSRYRSPLEATYQVIRPLLTVGGVQLQQGDLLPEDSPIRQAPRRLEQLVRMRKLRLVVSPGTAPRQDDDKAVSTRRATRTSPETLEEPEELADVDDVDEEELDEEYEDEDTDEEGGDEDEDTSIPEQLAALSWPDLRALAKENGVKASGSRDAIEERLAAALA